MPTELFFQFRGNLKNQMIFAGVPCELHGTWMLPVLELNRQ